MLDNITRFRSLTLQLIISCCGLSDNLATICNNVGDLCKT